MALQIAIVGSGPSGCYTAQALAKSCPQADITVIDQLCTPYGLIRYGVAPDHQGTKAVTRQFSRLFERQGVGFIGNLKLGHDISLETLRQNADVVVLALGLDEDRNLEIPGSQLSGVYGAGEITRYWNSHPDSQGFEPEFGKRVLIYGNGNVAADLIRILLKNEADLQGSDLDPDRVAEKVEEIHVVGRSPLTKAKFSSEMIHELSGIDDVGFSAAEEFALDCENAGPVAEAVSQLLDGSPATAGKNVIFHSGWTIAEYLEEAGKVRGVLLQQSGNGSTKTVDCDSVVTAIGFRAAGTLDRALILDRAEDLERGIIEPGLFVAGWFKRGPNGTIPDNRTDSISLASTITQYLETCSATKPNLQEVLENQFPKSTRYSDWLKIDAFEQQHAGEGRCRTKLATKDAMLAVIEKGI